MAPMTTQEIGDRLEISDVLLRYFRGLDRDDLELVRNCFSAESRLQYSGSFDGGRDECIEWLESPDGLGGCTQTMHFAGNMTVELAGDTAETETYAMAQHKTSPEHPWGDAFTTMWLRYLDRFRREPDAWRIVHRVAVVEWVRLDTAGMWADYASTSRRDRLDPSYWP